MQTPRCKRGGKKGPQAMDSGSWDPATRASEADLGSGVGGLLFWGPGTQDLWLASCVPHPASLSASS